MPHTHVKHTNEHTDERYLFGRARHQALVKPQGLLLREALGLVVPHQSALDLCGGEEEGRRRRRRGMNENRSGKHGGALMQQMTRS